VSRIADAVVAFLLGGIDDRLEVLHLLRDGAGLEPALRISVAREREPQRVDPGFLEGLGEALGPGTILVPGDPVTDDHEQGGVRGIPVELVIEGFFRGILNFEVHGVTGSNVRACVEM